MNWVLLLVETVLTCGCSARVIEQFQIEGIQIADMNCDGILFVDYVQSRTNALFDSILSQ